jgi:hypothetical protein
MTHDPELVAAMAEAFDNAGLPHGSTRPKHSACEPTWRAQCRRQMSSALTAAERAGFRIVKGEGA